MMLLRTLPVLGILFGLAGPFADRPAAAAEPLKVFCVARPPAADADEKTRKDQEEAPKADRLPRCIIRSHLPRITTRSVAQTLRPASRHWC